jgi:superfamily II DNA or RNA helicase
VNNLDLFNAPAAPPEPPAPPSTSGLRDYQIATVEAVRAELKENRGTLALLATGTGKTQIACELIKHWPGRSLFIAHRDELIQQAAKRLEQFTGDWPDIEQAGAHATPQGGAHVVASIQSISRQGRLERFDPNEFDLIVVDEAHHGTARTYRRVLDYFESAKVLGLTATADRADGEALGQIVDSVAYQYELPDAISDGWLCPVRFSSVTVDGLDFSPIHTVAGDFNKGELDALMASEENLHAVARPTVELAGDRKTLVFTTSVHNAHRLAEIIDRYTTPGAAFAIDGKTDKDDRRRLLQGYHAGEHQFFVNVGIATEGYDEPEVACVVMGRPTKSRSLYAQMAGRGTRGGVRCPVGDKTDLLVLDFVGNSGRHDVVSALDILGGRLSDDELARAKKVARESERPTSMEQALEEARIRHEKHQRELAEIRNKSKRKGVRANVNYSVESDPYKVLGVRRDYMYDRYGYAQASEKQIAAIEKMMGKRANELPQLISKHEASRMLGKLVGRAKANKCTYAQMRALQKFGYEAENWTFKQANLVMSMLASNGWRKPPDRMVEQIINT